MASSTTRSILWLDGSGGLVVGVLLFLGAEWLVRLFALPPGLYFAIATANLVYGSFAMSLAVRQGRSVRLISVLACANALWGCFCLVAAVSVFGDASFFGLAHILAEGAFVFWLAWFEWRHRRAIAGVV